MVQFVCDEWMFENDMISTDPYTKGSSAMNNARKRYDACVARCFSASRPPCLILALHPKFKCSWWSKRKVRGVFIMSAAARRTGSLVLLCYSSAYCYFDHDGENRFQI